MVCRVNDEKSHLRVIKAELEFPVGGSGIFAFLSAKYPDGSYPKNGDRRIKMILENGMVEYMPFYGDEISISTSEVVGKRLNRAWDVFFKKDLAYIRGETYHEDETDEEERTYDRHWLPKTSTPPMVAC